MQRGIGFFGGTFDPVHNGHLAVALGALEAMHLLRVDFVPAPSPWQKKVFTPLHLRVKMLAAAAGNNDRLGINLIEAEREGLTYTIDTIAELRRRTGPSMPIVLILGADQWTNFHTWKSWQDFASFVSIALCSRDGEKGEPAAEVSAWASGRWCEAGHLTETPCGRLATFQIPAHEASSTKIRRIFATCTMPEALRLLETWLPLPVASCISEHGIYGRTREKRRIVLPGGKETDGHNRTAQQDHRCP